MTSPLVTDTKDPITGPTAEDTAEDPVSGPVPAPPAATAGRPAEPGASGTPARAGASRGHTMPSGRPGPALAGRKAGGRHRASRRRRRSRFLAMLLGAVSTALLAFTGTANGDDTGGTVSTPLVAFAGTANGDDPEGAMTAAQGRFAWPLTPPHTVSRPFQPPTGQYGPGHRGVDLAATPGQQVMAADTGVVVFAGTLAGRGVIAIDHDGGLRTTYEPVKPSVVLGDQVYQGQVLGTVVAGHEGCPVAACLHWGARHGDVYIDPLPLVAEGGEIRLKPWSAPA
jgi:murein DD-endopeptidase MepM/ murein hydrolase activator NlpD